MAEHEQPGGNDRSADTDRLEAEVEAAREQLGQTVDALGQKMDVKSRARHGLGDAKARARARLTGEDGRLRREVPALAGAAVAVLLVVLARRRRRNG